jgi:ABC-type transport system involved in cytochrome bd biosynthesis fused ATPase/permease subunit
MKFDKNLLRTVLFAVGVVAVVIGIYQTIFYNDLARNYWLFMVAMTCWMPLLYWRQQERLAEKIAEQEAKLAKQARVKTPAKSTKKRR